MSYQLQKAHPQDVPVIFEMILEKDQWMKEKGITQWQDTHYLDIFPLSYYQQEQEKGNLFVLTDNKHNIIASAVVNDYDSNWHDHQPALYIHRLVSRPHLQGGSYFLKRIEDYARQLNKHYIRLDSMTSNQPLTQYYQKHGFIAVGECEEGLYQGTLRQKAISPQKRVSA